MTERCEIPPNLYDYVSTTRVEEYPSLMVSPGHDTYVASEAHQPGGSFKVRGATAYLLKSAEPKVVTASAGSFAAGLGYAAQSLEREADVFVPTSTPRAKLELVRSFGASVFVAGKNYPEALQAAKTHSEHHGIPYVSPFDDAAVIAGARSLGNDIVARTPDSPRTIYVPIGGGGLMAGVLEATAHDDNIHVVGVQYAGHTSAEQSLQSGKLIPAVGELDTHCEGSAVRQIGALPFSLMKLYRDNIDGLVTVSPAEVGESLWHEVLLRQKLVPPYGVELAFDGMPETTALVAEAGMRKWIMSGRARQGIHVAVRTGGNTDPARESHLLDTYRESRFSPDQKRTKVFLGAHVA